MRALWAAVVAVWVAATVGAQARDRVLLAAPPIFGHVLLQVPRSSKLVSVGGQIGDLRHLGSAPNATRVVIAADDGAAAASESSDGSESAEVQPVVQAQRKIGIESSARRMWQTARILQDERLAGLILMNHTSANFTLWKSDTLRTAGGRGPEHDVELLQDVLGSTAHFVNSTHLLVLFGARGEFDDQTIRMDEAHGVSLVNLATGVISPLRTWFAPSARFGHVSMYNPSTRRVFMYGGYVLGNRSISDELYSLSLDTLVWTPFRPIEDAERYIRCGQFGASSISLDGVHWLICFGVDIKSRQPSSECAVFDSNNKVWIRPSVDGDARPSAREGASMVHVPGSDRVIVVGGYDSKSRRFLNELAELRLDATARSLRWDRAIALHQQEPTALEMEGRAWHAAAMIDTERMVIWGGRQSAGLVDGSLYVLDTTTMAWSAGNVGLFNMPTGVLVVSVMGLMFLVMVVGVMGVMLVRWLWSRRLERDVGKPLEEYEPLQSPGKAAAPPELPPRAEKVAQPPRDGQRHRASLIVTPPVPVLDLGRRPVAVESPANDSGATLWNSPSSRTRDTLGMKAAKLVLDATAFSPVPPPRETSEDTFPLATARVAALLRSLGVHNAPRGVPEPPGRLPDNMPQNDPHLLDIDSCGSQYSHSEDDGLFASQASYTPHRASEDGSDGDDAFDAYPSVPLVVANYTTRDRPDTLSDSG